MCHLRSIHVDIRTETAWVQCGATLGELFSAIAEKSPTHAFPAGVCPTYGNLMRKHGLSVDNVVDARLVDARGEILDRESMGEDLFWAIRGGGPSFGVVLAYRVKWQHFAPAAHVDLFVRVLVEVVKKTSRRPRNLVHLKRKSDYVQRPIDRPGLEAIWRKMMEVEVVKMAFNPYGGRMSEIAAEATPFPHRAGNLWKIQYQVNWDEGGAEAERRHVALCREMYDYMTPYVSRNPRASFLNYKDLDLGVNGGGGGAAAAEGYGRSYFKGNFDRLVKIKSKVDPHNLFRHEQSVPTYLCKPKL
ncbi:unnamed protein product [Linum tenue]|uniref:FAD-binding PCMH-type domain-containing protein n=1 Tax=Linum tenue TaxID=586396 RepID=A0AAV0IA28_9ROSI|nr:unnamed protein product [Linum tenue]CAI0399691.1 unnamed protein product [Linum tenue]